MLTESDTPDQRVATQRQHLQQWSGKYKNNTVKTNSTNCHGFVLEFFGLSAGGWTLASEMEKKIAQLLLLSRKNLLQDQTKSVSVGYHSTIPCFFRHRRSRRLVHSAVCLTKTVFLHKPGNLTPEITSLEHILEMYYATVISYN